MTGLGVGRGRGRWVRALGEGGREMMGSDGCRAALRSWIPHPSATQPAGSFRSLRNDSLNLLSKWHETRSQPAPLQIPRACHPRWYKALPTLSVSFPVSLLATISKQWLPLPWLCFLSSSSSSHKPMPFLFPTAKNGPPPLPPNSSKAPATTPNTQTSIYTPSPLSPLLPTPSPPSPKPPSPSPCPALARPPPSSPPSSPPPTASATTPPSAIAPSSFPTTSTSFVVASPKSTTSVPPPPSASR